MKTKLLYVTGLLILLAVALYFTSVDTQTKNPSVQTSTPVQSTDQEAMDAHMKQMNDGKTIMAMGSKFTPETLYVKPNASLQFANHESVEMSLMVDTAALSSNTGSGKTTTFQAPQTVGTYHFISSANPNLKGTLIVEE